jgi:DNA polymerase beta
MSASEQTVGSIIHIFTKLQHQLRSDVKAGTSSFKIKHYAELIKHLQATRKPDDVVRSADEFASIPKCGKGTLARIEEILKTGTLSEFGPKLVDAQEPAADAAELQALQQVTGIGPAKATALLQQGVTLAKLLQPEADEQANLTHHQRLGVKYFADLQARILRPHIAAFEEQLVRLLPTGFRPVVCGSYRRGVASSGDVDVLLDGGESEATAAVRLRDCLAALRACGCLLDDLVAAPKTKYMGFARIQGRAEAGRIDIRAVPSASYVPSLLYFTGSKEENVRVRKLLLKKGLRLNEYALAPLEGGEPVAVASEAELYEQHLGEPYKPPESR